MSLRAEIVRLALRLLLKPSNGPTVSIARRRAREADFERWVPRAPRRARLCEDTLGGVPALRVKMPASRSARRILYLHGGGYVTGSPALYRHVLWRLAETAEAEIVAIDYRLAPEHPFPAALDDAVGAWRDLLAEGADSRGTVVMGDSAGGGLALALALRLRDDGIPTPAAIVALSPWTDLALTGKSLHEKAAVDPMQNAADVPFLAAAYLGDADPRNPYASPLYGNLAGLAPTLIHVGSDEILLDDAARMATAIRAAGAVVELEVWPRMPHVWHAFAFILPEARRAIARIGEFVIQHTTL